MFYCPLCPSLLFFAWFCRFCVSDRRGFLGGAPRVPESVSFPVRTLPGVSLVEDASLRQSSSPITSPAGTERCAPLRRERVAPPAGTCASRFFLSSSDRIKRICVRTPLFRKKFLFARCRCRTIVNILRNLFYRIFESIVSGFSALSENGSMCARPVIVAGVCFL